MCLYDQVMENVAYSYVHVSTNLFKSYQNPVQLVFTYAPFTYYKPGRLVDFNHDKLKNLCFTFIDQYVESAFTNYTQVNVRTKICLLMC